MKRKYGLIGFPLGHSFSAGYFEEKFVREALTNCSYENFPVQDIYELKELLTREEDLIGLNVTIPHKSSVIGFLNHIDTAASDIGSVNVIKIRREKGEIFLSGYNSDVTGIKDTLLNLGSKLPGYALILGSGGSSKAVKYTLKELGIDFTVISRNPDKGQVGYSAIKPSLMEKAGLIINTTPLGMFPDISSFPPIDYNCLNSNHILFDLVYNPVKTMFLTKGEQRGCTIINGLRMLHVQAERSWEIWNDPDLP